MVIKCHRLLMIYRFSGSSFSPVLHHGTSPSTAERPAPPGPGWPPGRCPGSGILPEDMLKLVRGTDLNPEADRRFLAVQRMKWGVKCWWTKKIEENGTWTIPGSQFNGLFSFVKPLSWEKSLVSGFDFPQTTPLFGAFGILNKYDCDSCSGQLLHCQQLF